MWRRPLTDLRQSPPSCGHFGPQLFITRVYRYKAELVSSIHSMRVLIFLLLHCFRIWIEPDHPAGPTTKLLHCLQRNVLLYTSSCFCEMKRKLIIPRNFWKLTSDGFLLPLSLAWPNDRPHRLSYLHLLSTMFTQKLSLLFFVFPHFIFMLWSCCGFLRFWIYFSHLHRCFWGLTNQFSPSDFTHTEAFNGHRILKEVILMSN